MHKNGPRPPAIFGGVVESFVSAGQHLKEAKADLGFVGYEWEQWLEKSVGITRNAAKLLMGIAAYGPIRSDPHMFGLPGDARTLYELTKLPEDAFRRAIKDRYIYPDMRHRDAVELVRYITSTPVAEHG